MKFMKLLFYLFLLSAAVALRASVANLPKPGWPTESYATFVDRCLKAEFAVFEYSDGRKVFIANQDWLGALKAALPCDKAEPDALCFCKSDPVLKLFSREQLLATIELTHDRKIRFGGSDFILPAEFYDAHIQLWRTALAGKGFVPPKKSPGHAAKRVELRP